MGDDTGGDLKATNYELFIAALSVLYIVNTIIYFLPISDDTRGVIVLVDALLILIFLTDFVVRFLTAPSRSRYFFRQLGWLDLLGSLPYTGLGVFRLFRLVRVGIFLRRYGFRRLARSLLRDLAASGLTLIALLAIVVLEVASISVLIAERPAPNANITTAGDALWWGVVTVATVGYGDKYPVTAAGRLTGVALMVVGVGIFGVLTGYLANRFLQPSPTQRAPAQHGTTDDPQSTLAEIRRLLDEQEQGRAVLATRLAELERLIRTGGSDGRAASAPSTTATPRPIPSSVASNEVER